MQLCKKQNVNKHFPAFLNTTYTYFPNTCLKQEYCFLVIFIAFVLFNIKSIQI